MADPAATFSYDLLAYPSPIIATLTPNRIAAAGLLFGWQAPDPKTASVLEIGCGDGYNLIGIGAEEAQSRCVGFDLSGPTIEFGRAVVRAAGLTNVDLHKGDILTYPRDGEKFDYIVAHGIYSWVPPLVREGLMELIGARLKPGGIAYVSYDCMPASAPKQAIISFLTARVGHIADFEQRIDAAHEMIRILAESQPPDSRLKVTLDALVHRMKDYGRSYFFHDWLSESYHPSALGSFAEGALPHGLKVVGDAELSDLFLGDINQEGRDWLGSEGRDAASHGGLIDMLRGTQTFRRTLLTTADTLLPMAWQGHRKLLYSYIGTREELEDGRVKYVSPTSVSMTAGDPKEIKILDALHAHAPAELTYDEVVRLSGLTEDEVTPNLRESAVIGLLEINVTPPVYTLTPGERPRAGQLVRAMFANGDWAISLRHLRTTATGQPTRLLIVLCDGNRDHAELARVLTEEVKQEIGVEQVREAIEELAQRYLFEA